MKLYIGKLLLCLYLFSFTPLKELLRIPILVLHYQSHLQEDSNMSMEEFFTIHYFDENVIDNDYLQDKQLPFKSTLDINTSLQLMLVDVNIFIENYYLTDGYAKSYFLPLENTTILKPYIAGIFHPPQTS